MVAPEPLRIFVDQVAAHVAGELGDQLVGVYLVGSAAMDDWQPESSDVDVAAVSGSRPRRTQLQTLADRLLATAEHAPARGLEFVLYRESQARAPDGSVTLNVNCGPGMPRRVDFNPEDFWFLIDAAILRDSAVTVSGPPAADVFGLPPPDLIRSAIDRSLRWHAQDTDRPHAGVLAACRSWHYSEVGHWLSKSTAADWAKKRSPDDAALIDHAVACRMGRGPEIGTGAAGDFIERVRLRACPA